MKLRKVFGAACALAMAVSAAAVTTVTSSAAFDPEGHIICMVSNDDNVPVLKDKSLLTDIYGFKATISVDRYRDFESAVNAGDWFGGGVGKNCSSTTWTQLAEWSVQEGAKDIVMAPTDTRGVYTITYTQADPCFTATEEYAFFWLQDWSSDKSYTLKVDEVVLLDKDGNNVMDKAPTTPAEPDEPAAPTEEPAEPTEEPAEPTEEPAEPTEEPAEPTEEPVDMTVEPEETAEPAETEPADTNTDAPAPSAPATDSKGSPDTGVAGIAAAAGVAALAGVAVVVARKRK